MFIEAILTERPDVCQRCAVTLPSPLWRRALAEFLSTGLLVAVVVGSGVAAQRPSPRLHAGDAVTPERI